MQCIIRKGQFDRRNPKINLRQIQIQRTKQTWQWHQVVAMITIKLANDHKKSALMISNTLGNQSQPAGIKQTRQEHQVMWLR